MSLKLENGEELVSVNWRVTTDGNEKWFIRASDLLKTVEDENRSETDRISILKYFISDLVVGEDSDPATPLPSSGKSNDIADSGLEDYFSAGWRITTNQNDEWFVRASDMLETLRHVGPSDGRILEFVRSFVGDLMNKRYETDDDSDNETENTAIP
jgi:hypothetical protein